MPVIKERLATQGVAPDAMSVDEFAKLFAQDRQLMARIVKEARLTRD